MSKAVTPTKENTIFKLFADLPFEEQVVTFGQLRQRMQEAFELQHKNQENRAVYLKEAYQTLLNR